MTTFLVRKIVRLPGIAIREQSLVLVCRALKEMLAGL